MNDDVTVDEQTQDRQRLADLLNDLPQGETAVAARGSRPDPDVLPRQAQAQPRSVTPIERTSLLEHSDEITELLKALVAATLEFDEIEKDLTADVQSKRTGTRYQFDYASLKEINSKIRRPLAAKGLVIMHGSRVSGSVCLVRTTLWHVSGQWVRNDLIVGLGGTMDPQAIGTAISYSKRYNILAILNLSPGESEDDNGAMLAEAAAAQGVTNGPRPAQRKSQQQPQQQPPKANVSTRLEEARTKPPIGKIKELAAKDGVTYVALESGYLACTRDADKIELLAKCKERNETVEFVAEGKPGFAPKITEIMKHAS